MFSSSMIKAQFPPRCKKTELKLRKVNKTENVLKMRAIYECCEGYDENEQKTGCDAHCSNPCIHGKCVSPEKCQCEEGYGGPSCDISKTCH